MKRIATIILLFSLLGAGTMQAQSIKKNAMTTKEEILQLQQQLLEAISQKKAAVLEEFIRPEFIFTAATGEAWERNKFINGFSLNPAIRLPLLAASKQQVMIVEKTAVITSLYQIHIIRGENKPQEELWELTTETWVQEGSKWRILAMQATYAKREN